MNLRTYQAYSMAEALAAVKRDLGADAIILNTRTFQRGGLLGLGRRTIIELTASANTPADGSRSGSTPAERTAAIASAATPGQRRLARRAYGQTALATEPARESAVEAAPTERDRDRTRRLAQAMLEQHRRRANGPYAVHGHPEDAPDPMTAEAADAVTPMVAAASGPPKPEPRPEPVPEMLPVPTPRIERDPARRVARRFLLNAPPDEASGAVAVVDAPSPVAVVGSAGSCGFPDPADPRGHADHRDPIRRPAPFGVAREAGNGNGRGVPDPVTAEDAAVRAELGAIRRMVGEVLQRQVPRTGVPTPTMPDRLFDMYLKMIGQEVSEELADQVVNEVRDELTAMQLEDEDAVRAAVRRRLADFIPTVDEAIPERPRDGRPLTIVLIGPTGVGKTTTLAKLAATFKLRHGRRVGLITADTYRIAAVDQLRTYANIIGLPLNVALTPGEMRQAVRAMRDQDVILIDTAGRSKNDGDRIAELRRFVEAADPHEVHLVLSSTAGEKVLVREAEAFGAVGVDKIVLTKLDEAVSFGMLVNVVRRIGKNLSFFTTGQEVPDQIEVSRPERLAELILGADVHA